MPTENIPRCSTFHRSTGQETTQTTRREEKGSLRDENPPSGICRSRTRRRKRERSRRLSSFGPELLQIKRALARLPACKHQSFPERSTTKREKIRCVVGKPPINKKPHQGPVTRSARVNNHGRTRSNFFVFWKKTEPEQRRAAQPSFK